MNQVVLFFWRMPLLYICLSCHPVPRVRQREANARPPRSTGLVRVQTLLRRVQGRVWVYHLVRRVQGRVWVYHLVGSAQEPKKGAAGETDSLIVSQSKHHL